MKILVGNDTKSTAAGYASAAASIALLITGFLGFVSLQIPRFSWMWAILGAGVVCAANIYRIVIGVKMNYLQADPNTVPQDNPAVVNVQTTGATPETTPAPATPAK